MGRSDNVAIVKLWRRMKVAWTRVVKCGDEKQQVDSDWVLAAKAAEFVDADSRWMREHGKPLGFRVEQLGEYL